MNAIADSVPQRTVARASGRLEDLVREVCDAIVLGAIEPPEGKGEHHWTPSRIAKVITERYPGSGAKPSAGAITDTFKRWSTLGFAVISDHPVAFVDYTVEGRAHGLTALKAARKQRLMEENQARRALNPPKKKKKEKASADPVAVSD